MKKDFWKCFVCLTCMMIFGLCPISSWSQQPAKSSDPIITLTMQQAASFHEAFSALAHKSGMAFVAEDQPLYQVLPARIVLAIASSGEPLSRVVGRIAAAYDYDVQRKEKVFVLRKRFSDPTDLPDVTLAECMQSLTDEHQALNALDPHLNFAQLEQNESIHNLITSLTPDQLQVMHDKTNEAFLALKNAKTPDEIYKANLNVYQANVQARGLPISELTPDQREAIQQIILVVRVQIPSALLDIVPVQDAAQKDPRFCLHETKDHLSLFGYEISTGQKTKVFSALASSEQILSRSNGTIKRERSQTKMVSTAGADLATSSSLAQIVADLNKRSGVKVSVDAALAPKRVLIFGGTDLPVTVIIKALADVYGLRVKVKEDGSLLLTRQLLHIPLNYPALVTNVQNALPDPLARAALRAGEREKMSAGFVQSRPYWGTARNTQINSLSLRDNALNALKREAEPRIRLAKDAHVPLSSLSDQADTNLAIILALPSIERLADFAAQEIPEVISRFDELRLLGGPSREGQGATFELELALPGADDTQPLKRVMHIGNLNYAQ